MRDILIKFRKNNNIKKIFEIIIDVLLFLYLFSIPSFSGRYPLNYILYLIFILLSLLTIFYTFLFEKLIILNYRIFPIVIFTILSFVSTLFYSHMFRDWLTIFLLCVTTIIFLIIMDNKEKKDTIALICLAAFSLFSIYYIIIYRNEIFNFSNTLNIRLGDYFDNQNQIGTYFSILFLLAVYFCLFNSGYIRFVYAFISIVSLFLGLTTGSKTFIVVAMFGLIIVTYFRFKHKPILYFVLLTTFIIAVIVLFNLPFAKFLKERFLSFLETLFYSDGQDASTLTRIIWQEYGFYLGLKNIFIGLGARGFAVFSGVGTYTHGDFSDIFCNFGFLGFCAYYGTWIICFLGQKSVKTPIKNIAITLLILMLVKGFLGVSYTDKINSFILSFVLSVCVSDFNKNYYELRI